MWNRRATAPPWTRPPAVAMAPARTTAPPQTFPYVPFPRARLQGMVAGGARALRFLYSGMPAVQSWSTRVGEETVALSPPQPSRVREPSAWASPHLPENVSWTTLPLVA